MNTQANTLFNFISSSNVVDFPALQSTSAPHPYYQKLIYSSLTRSIYTAEGFELLGRQLAELARHANFAKQTDLVEQVSRIMLALPVSAQLKNVARHYQALCAKRKGDYEGARRLLERVVEEASPQYKARALLTIGATYFDSGKVEAALPFYLASGQVSHEYDALTLIESQRAIAIIRSIHGDHKQALDDLERLYPLAQAIGRHYPAFYYDYLNSLAVELGEVGRIEEARNVCRITLASPLAAAYPNWLETSNEIEARRVTATASIVAVGVVIEAVASPQAQPKPHAEPEPQAKPARKPKLVCWTALIQHGRETNLIQTATTIAIAAIVHLEIATSILERVRDSIIVRGPPA